MPDSLPSDKRAAVVRITRTLVYDDHVADGGKLPDIDPDTPRILLDYDRRAPVSQPVVRSYTVKIAVPGDHPHSWELCLGDDYELLVTTRGFTTEANGIRIDGQVVSNYQLQLDERKPPMGPNSFGFGLQAIGERVLVQVMNDEAPGRIFREFDETEIEQITPAPGGLSTIGIDEGADAQQRRQDAWTPIRKRSLR
jgi:hypothetical protein